MNADAFRRLYDYHFSENRKIWEHVEGLPYETFIQEAGYSRGSVCNQVVHLIRTDEAWFSDLRGQVEPPRFDAGDRDDRPRIRLHWDQVEGDMRAYLSGLQDDALLTKPFPPGPDEKLHLWEALIHVVNHGTDHRAQILRLLNDLGVKTGPQDFAFFAEHH